MNALALALFVPMVFQGNVKDDTNALKLALADERLARATYEVVIDAFGEKPPFTNIIRAETQHARMVEMAMARHNIPVPADRTKKPAKPESWESALKTAIQAEKDNIALYGRLFKLDLSPDVRQVLTNLQKMSQERHLPAFERSLAGECQPGAGCGGMGMGRGMGAGRGQGMGPGNGQGRNGQGGKGRGRMGRGPRR